jgi:hypothetical protein
MPQRGRRYPERVRDRERCQAREHDRAAHVPDSVREWEPELRQDHYPDWEAAIVQELEIVREMELVRNVPPNAPNARVSLTEKII